MRVTAVRSVTQAAASGFRRFLLGICLSLATVFPVSALELSDVAGDAARYGERLSSRTPAAGESLATHLRAAKEAESSKRWKQAIRAYEALISQRPEDAETWLRLGRAWREYDSKAVESAAAAYAAFLNATRPGSRSDAVASEALLLLARQLEQVGRRDAAIRVWAEVGRFVTDPALDRLLAELKGTRQDKLEIEWTPEPLQFIPNPRWCIRFSAPLDEARFDQYRRWIKVKRLTPGADKPWEVDIAVSGENICVYGLRHGDSYQIAIAADLAAADGRTLGEATTETIEVGDREPDLAFKSDTLVLPTNGRGSVPLSFVNIKEATLLLFHVTDRQLINELAIGNVNSNLSDSALDQLASHAGRLVWWGNVELGGARNLEQTTALPIGDVLAARASWSPGATGTFAPGFLDDGSPANLGPGVYAVVATPRRLTRNPLEIVASESLADELIPYDMDWYTLPTQWIVRTDLGIQVLRGPSGVHAIARSLLYGTAVPNVRVQLVAEANRVLAEGLTDGDGLASFDPGLARGVLGNRLRGILAFSPDGDFTFLDADGDGLDLSDRGVAGREAPGPMDAFVWTERGIYRPGETVHTMLMVRNERAEALDPPPLQLRLVAPDETISSDLRVTEFKAGAAHLPLSLPRTAMHGNWRIEVRAGRDTIIGKAGLQVEAFVPNRIELELAGPTDASLEAGKPLPIAVRARYLYGAPAVDLTGLYRLTLRRAELPFSEYQHYRFGPEEKSFSEAGPLLPLARTSAQGETRAEVMLDTLPDTPVPLEARLRVQIDDTDGGSVGKEFTLKVRHTDRHWIGLRARDASGMMPATQIEIVALNADGRRVARRLEWELYAEEEEFQWLRHRDDYASDYGVYLTRRLLRRGKVAATAAGNAAVLNFDDPLGRYYLKVVDTRGALSELSFTQGFEGARNVPGRPDLVRIILDNEHYRPGETITARIEAKFAGELMLAVLSDRVHKVINRKIGTEPFTVRVPVESNWGPRPYLLATVFRGLDPAKPGPDPARAVGVANFGIRDPGAIPSVSIDAAPTTSPNRPDMPVTIRVTGLRPGAAGFVTLAAVDAGILSLTDYLPPSPDRYFFGPRRLALELLDNYNRMIVHEGAAAAIRSGGDRLGPLRGLDYTWPKPVVWFSGIQALDSQGRVRLSVDVPDFLGRLELIAVAWTADQSAVARSAVLVRDVVVARPDLPRFIAPGDAVNAAIDLHNFRAAAGDYHLTIGATGPVRLRGETQRTLHLTEGDRERVEFRMEAVAIDASLELDLARIEMRLRARDNSFDVARTWEIPVRPAVQPTTRTVRTHVAPGRSLMLTKDAIKGVATDMVPTTVRLRHRIGRMSSLDHQLFQDEVSRPALAAEEFASRVALLLVPVAQSGGWTAASGPLRLELSRALSELLALQRKDGGFRSFPGDRLSSFDARASYIADVLASARDLGAPVPPRAISSVSHYLQQAVDYSDCTTTDAYQVFVLARLGHATFTDIDGLRQACEESDMNANLEGRVLAMAALQEYGLSVDRKGGLETLAASIGQAREQPMSMLVDLVYGLSSTKARGALMEKLLAATRAATDKNPRIGLETRAKLALSQIRLAPEKSAPIDISINGERHRIAQGGWNSPELRLASMNRSIDIDNRSQEELVHELSVRGISTKIPGSVTDAGFRIGRQLYRLRDGVDPDRPIDPLTIKLDRNELLGVVIEGVAQAGGKGLAVLTDFLPAGWHIEDADIRAGFALSPDARARLQLDSGNNTAVLRREAHDDRLLALIELDRAREGFRFAYVVRAAYAGEFIWPSLAIESLQDAGFAGGTTASRVTVSPGG